MIANRNRIKCVLTAAEMSLLLNQKDEQIGQLQSELGSAKSKIESLTFMSNQRASEIETLRAALSQVSSWNKSPFDLCFHPRPQLQGMRESVEDSKRDVEARSRALENQYREVEEARQTLMKRLAAEEVTLFSSLPGKRDSRDRNLWQNSHGNVPSWCSAMKRLSRLYCTAKSKANN